MSTTDTPEIRSHSLYEVMAREERRPMRTAVIVAVVFHIILFVVRFPEMVSRLVEPTVYRIVNIKPLDSLPQNAGGGPQPTKTIEMTSPSSVPKPQPTFVPVPDLTPNEPEPVYEEQKITLPDFDSNIVGDLSIGEIYGPAGGSGGGSGGGTGAGIGPGEGDGVYSVGAGIIPPEAILKPSPKFTDDAIRNRISGVVLLYGIIRKDGRVDSLKVVRNLGYGLDEEALATVATKWKFRPAMKDGRPVDCYVTIEVNFTLY
jgi:TonB family protein